MCVTLDSVPKRSNNASLLVVLVLFMASMVGLGAIVAWLVRQMADTARQQAQDAQKWASNTAADAETRASDLVQRTMETMRGSMPVGRVDVGDIEATEQTWEAALPWFRQGEGYDPTDAVLPDPQDMTNGNRTVLVPTGTDLLEFVKTQPTPQGFAMPLPDLSGEDA